MIDCMALLLRCTAVWSPFYRQSADASETCDAGRAKQKKKRGKGRGSLHPSRPVSGFAPPHAYPAFLPLDVKEAETTATQLRFRRCRYSPVLNLSKQVSKIVASYKHARIYNNASEQPRSESRALSDDQFLSSLQCKSIFGRAKVACLFSFITWSPPFDFITEEDC